MGSPKKNLDPRNIPPTLSRDDSSIAVEPVAVQPGYGADCSKGGEIGRDCAQIDPNSGIDVSKTHDTTKTPLLIRGEGVEV